MMLGLRMMTRSNDKMPYFKIPLAFYNILGYKIQKGLRQPVVVLHSLDSTVVILADHSAKLDPVIGTK